jgi:hypothetical protein
MLARERGERELRVASLRRRVEELERETGRPARPEAGPGQDTHELALAELRAALAGAGDEGSSPPDMHPGARRPRRLGPRTAAIAGVAVVAIALPLGTLHRSECSSGPDAQERWSLGLPLADAAADCRERKSAAALVAGELGLD